MSCPVCEGSEGETFLVRRAVPVHQNLLFADEASARGVARGDLSLAFCPACGFVWNRTFDGSLLRYGEDYENSQAYSPSFQAHMLDRVRSILADGFTNGRVVEVGCGKGAFLRELIAASGPNAHGFGFDPSYVGPDADLGGRVEYVRRFYGRDCAAYVADVIVCRHVIEHLGDPATLLASLRAALGTRGDARVYFETPSVEWILENQVIWDFFYEHCSLFTGASLRTLFERRGFRVDAVLPVFAGQYLWLSAGLGNAAAPHDPGRVPELARAFGRAERDLTEGWKRRLDQLRRDGPVALWGAGAKGSTLANLVDPLRERISCVVDVNPKKQGRFVPGTGHPIVAPHELRTRDVRMAILMNPNYRAENEELLRREGLTVSLVE